jgi:hypothetical protein
MMSAELIDLNDSCWRAFSIELGKALGVYPNELRHDGNGHGALVVWKAQNSDDFPMNKSGVEYLVKAHRDGRVDGRVVLARRRDGKIETVAVKDIEQVAAMISNVTPKEGRFGPYWWLNAGFTFGSFSALDEAPF